MEKKEKIIGDYRVLLYKPLGQGSSGTVYEGVNIITKQPVAVKIISKKSLNSTKKKIRVMEEMRLLRQTQKEQCPNIVKLYDLFSTENNYHIVMEKCDSDLNVYLSQFPKKKMVQNEAIQMLKRICNGLIPLLKEGYVHRDIKPHNILIRKGRPKISDFGYARHKHSDHPMNSLLGTPIYQSPQIRRMQQYTSKSDVWSLGVVFYQMLHGCTPWKCTTVDEILQKIQEIKQLKFQPNLSQSTKNFISKCLEIEQANRYSWDQLLGAPIFEIFFDKYFDQKKRLQNTLKVRMDDINNLVKSKGITRKQLFKSLNFKQPKQITYDEFAKLLKQVAKYIKQAEIQFCFQKIDTDRNFKISIQQLQIQILKATLNIDNDIVQTMRDFFKNLKKILNSKKKTLQQVFEQFDVDDNKVLDERQFGRFMKKISSNLEDWEIELIFVLLDKDSSNTIQLDQLNNQYMKANEQKQQKQQNLSINSKNNYNLEGNFSFN